MRLYVVFAPDRPHRVVRNPDHPRHGSRAVPRPSLRRSCRLCQYALLDGNGNRGLPTAPRLVGKTLDPGFSKSVRPGLHSHLGHSHAAGCLALGEAVSPAKHNECTAHRTDARRVGARHLGQRFPVAFSNFKCQTSSHAYIVPKPRRRAQWESYLPSTTLGRRISWGRGRYCFRGVQSLWRRNGW